jgi:hypothetical protein
MLYGPNGEAVQNAWARQLRGRMVQSRVIFLQRVSRQKVQSHTVNVQDIDSVAAFFGQGTRDGRGVEIQEMFC